MFNNQNQPCSQMYWSCSRHHPDLYNLPHRFVSSFWTLMCVAWTRALILIFYESDVFYYCENFFPPSQLDFSLCWICRSSINLIEAMNLLDGTWPSAPGPRIQFRRLDEIIEVPYLFKGKGPNLYQDRWPSKHSTLLGCLVQPGVSEVTLIIPANFLDLCLRFNDTKYFLDLCSRFNDIINGDLQWRQHRQLFLCFCLDR